MTSTQAALTVTERTLSVPDPTPSAAIIDGTTVQYLYNVGTKSYFLGANDWNTRASVSSAKGYKVKLTSTGDNTISITDSVETKKGWFKVFTDGPASIWVDNNSGANSGTWVLTAGADNTFTISNTAAVVADSLLGVVSGADTRVYLYPPTKENFNTTWYAVSSVDYATNIETRTSLLAVFNASELLWAALVEADAAGVEASALAQYEAVYANADATVEDLNAATVAVKEILKNYQASQATAKDPKDMTSLIVNSDFAANNATGWSGTALAFQSYADAEHYNKTYDTYQEISGMPLGVYALNAQAFYRAGGTADSYSDYKNGKAQNALLYAVNKVAAEGVSDTLTIPITNNFYGIQPNTSLGGNEANVKDGDDTYYVPNNMATAKTYFDAGYYKDNKVLFAVTEGTALIGVKKTVSLGNDWTIFNKFGLTYYGKGADAYQLWNDDMLSGAPTYDQSVVFVTPAVVDAYEAVKASVATASTYEQVKANLSSLDDAMAAVDANIAAWQSYNDEIALSKVITGGDQYQGDDVNILADYIEMDAPDILEAKSLTTEQIIAEAAKLKTLRENAVQNSIQPGADVTELLKNVDFSKGKDGWTFKAASGGNVTANSSAKCAEAWNNSDFDIYQTVENAPVGAYKISVQGFYRRGRDDAAWKFYFDPTTGDKLPTVPETPAYVYLNASKTPLANVFEYKVAKDENYYTGAFYTDAFDYCFPNDMADAGLAFDKGNYLINAVGLVAKKGDAMRIGMKGCTNQEGDSWAIFTRFKLTYMGYDVDVIKPQLQASVAAVDLTKPMGTDVKAKAQELIAAANAALEATDGKVMFNALAGITEYGDSIDASVALFAKMQTTADDLENLVAESTAAANVKTDAAAYIDEVRTNLAGYTNAQANAAIAKLADHRYLLSLPAGYENATDESPVDLTGLMQTPDFSKDNTNSIEGWQNTTGYSFGNSGTQKGALCVEFYEKDFDMYQDVTVPNGTYQVTAYAFDRYKSADGDYDQYAAGTESLAKLYVKSGDKEVVKPIEHLASDINAATEAIGSGAETTYNNNAGVKYNVPNDIVATRAYFDMGRYVNGVNIKVTDGKLRIGVRQADHETGCWVIMDEFKLWYLGTSSTAIEGGWNDVKGVETVGETQKVEIFTADGVKHNSYQNGLNIVVTTDANGNVSTKSFIVNK